MFQIPLSQTTFLWRESFLKMGAFDKLPWVDPAVLTRVRPWQELIERPHSPSRGDGMGADSGKPRQSYSNVPGQTGSTQGR